MSDKTATSLFMLSPLASRYVEFYQQLLKGLGSYQQLGNKLVQLAEQAHAFRQFDKVNEIGQFLSNLPIEDYRAIGHYYLAVASNRCGSGDMDKAKNLFELAVDTAPPMYRAKAILSLAAVSAHKKDTDSELYYFVESLKASGDFSTRIVALRGIAVHKAREGYHKQALNDLEQTLPLAKYAPPHIYFDYLNAVAVELWEAGCKSEARNIIKHVLASPFAFAYPEWQETANDLREPNRSFVVINQTKCHNILDIPATEHGETEQEINNSNSIRSPLLLDESDDNVVQFPHLVDLEKLEKESEERFSAEMDKFSALIDNCQLHDFVDSILIGDMNPARFAKFLLRMTKFEDIKTVQDVFHWMLRYTFFNSDEFKESETEWTGRLLKEIESTDTL